MSINQIILSCNEDPTYCTFWKPVAWAYKKMFPEATVHLALVTHRDENDPVVEEYRKHGKVTLFKTQGFVSEFAQAKMARFVLASMQGDDVCYVDDIDLFPLRRDFITNKTEQRPKDHLLCVGGEVYGNNGCYPISQMTAEGYIWKQFINPNDLKWKDLLIEWMEQPVYMDRREDPGIKLDWDKDDYFSDERLMRRLTHLNPVSKKELPRGYNDFLNDTIDRHTFDSPNNYWNFDRDRLKYGRYVNAHGVRPYTDYEEHYQPLVDYINETYD